MMYPKLKIQAGLLLVLFLGFVACKSPAKLLEAGRYDEAIKLAVKRLQGKKKKKYKYIKPLEEAFAKATKRDMRQVTNLKKEGRPANWEKINDIHRGIKARQDLIEPLLPLVTKKGYRAKFKFVKIDGLERESKQKSAEYLYAHGKKLLAEAKRNKDKARARKAFEELKKIKKYYKDFRDRDRLMAEARELGLSRILISTKNKSGMTMPKAFEDEIMRFSVHDMDDLWHDYTKKKKRGQHYDYSIVITFDDIDVSPERVKEREYTDEKKVKDGFEYVLDANGNVMKDSLGNDIKVDKYITLRAVVLESMQTKFATVGGRIDIFDNATGKLLRTERFSADAEFRHYASTFRGDREALSAESRRRIGSHPVPFPTTAEMLMDAADSLKPVIKDKILRSRVIF